MPRIRKNIIVLTWSNGDRVEMQRNDADPVKWDAMCDRMLLVYDDSKLTPSRPRRPQGEPTR